MEKNVLKAIKKEIEKHPTATNIVFGTGSIAGGIVSGQLPLVVVGVPFIAGETYIQYLKRAEKIEKSKLSKRKLRKVC